ncbi:MAG: FAD-dependent oxidoreductase [Micropruina sp.]
MGQQSRDRVIEQTGPSALRPGRAVRRLTDGVLDVLVVGGGITGVSCALDAALRELRVGLVEAEDFAAGTSSASSKMIHGGLRYIPSSANCAWCTTRCWSGSGSTNAHHTW